MEELEETNSLLRELLHQNKKLNEKLALLDEDIARLYEIIRAMGINDGAISRKDYSEAIHE